MLKLVTTLDGCNHRQAGFSLVELMIAMALSLFLLLGVTTVYLDSKGSYRTQDSLARVQENARFALLHMGRTLRMAGNIGCVGADFALSPPSDCNALSGFTNTVINSANAGSATNNLFAYGLARSVSGGGLPTGSYGVVGYDAFSTTSTHPSITNVYALISKTPTPQSTFASTYWLPAPSNDVKGVLDGNVIAASDVVAVRYADPVAATVVSSGATSISVVYPAGFSAFTAYELLVASICGHCAQVTVFQAGAITGSGPYTIARASGSTYQAGAEVARLRTYVFYIGQGASGSPALYQAILATNGSSTTFPTLTDKQELVDNVENMQVLYGVTNSSGGVSYLSADQVTDWSKVTSVKVGLLLRTQEDNLTTQNDTTTDTDCPSDTTYPTFSVLGVCIRPYSNRYIHRVVSTTINLRNRTL